MALYRAHILVCTGTGCAAANANGLAEEFEVQLKKFGLDQEIRVVKTGCLRPVRQGPQRGHLPGRHPLYHGSQG